MDRDGVDVELVNGPYEQLWQIKDPELRVACVRVVNDWARELYEESNGRFIMLLPFPVRRRRRRSQSCGGWPRLACLRGSSSTG